MRNVSGRIVHRRNAGSAAIPNYSPASMARGMLNIRFFWSQERNFHIVYVLC
jgi:hypothetical protein